MSGKMHQIEQLEEWIEGIRSTRSELWSRYDDAVEEGEAMIAYCSRIDQAQRPPLISEISRLAEENSEVGAVYERLRCALIRVNGARGAIKEAEEELSRIQRNGQAEVRRMLDELDEDWEARLTMAGVVVLLVIVKIVGAMVA